MSDQAQTEAAHVLCAREVSKHYRRRGATIHARQTVRAVERVSLALPQGTVTALVGESGSGKSTLAKVLAGLEPATSGAVLLDGSQIGAMRPREFRRYCASVQLIFQDPFASLSAHHSVAYHLERPLRIHGLLSRRADSSEVSAEIDSLLLSVGLPAGADFRSKLPHELSGGQRQRVAIARALATRPRVLIADEPVSMLDVSIRLSILEMLRTRQREDGLTVLYVTHDLPTALYFADTIAVMYAGQIVEYGPSEDVVSRPSHPYTQLLLDATPDPGRVRATLADRGEPPNLVDVPTGCPFHPRCAIADERCATTVPPAVQVAESRSARCWHVERGTAVDAHAPPG